MAIMPAKAGVAVEVPPKASVKKSPVASATQLAVPAVPAGVEARSGTVADRPIGAIETCPRKERDIGDVAHQVVGHSMCPFAKIGLG